MPDVYAAMGGNIDPAQRLKRALRLLKAEFGALTVSPVYRNPAVGFAGEDFLNLVVKFSTDLPASEVRQRLQAVEMQCDRPRDAPKWAARTMDIDILLYGDVVSCEPGLTLPRPDLVRRAYMLKPMADVAPRLVHPTLRKTMRELWSEFDADAHPMTALQEFRWRDANAGP
ncbi:MAG TPA: 2-amino-4-hydroxy-6-hydroxymethyldihydropteridine diphosphokinase [Steroidobacter sp.]|nr:2-amino-4-hydroxy-6-hydroxymethyldihydropteridine diphosphokinase [Steroidobacter sp.]